MPLTVNTFTGGGDGFSWGSGANWSLGHSPTSAEWAQINADNGAPTDTGGINRTVGALTLADNSHDNNYDFTLLDVPGDVELDEFHSDFNDLFFSGGNVGGNVVFNNCNAKFSFAALTGSGKTLTANGGGPVDLNGLVVPASYTIVNPENFTNYTQATAAATRPALEGTLRGGILGRGLLGGLLRRR